MAQWTNFYENDDFQPEIVVGMWDRWLSELGYGPTQAERVLVHTPMMEVAHERRFVFSETEQNMSDFEVEHPRRIEETIAHLQSHFTKHPADEQDDSILHQSSALIGLAPFPLESTFLASFPGPSQRSTTATPPYPQLLELITPTQTPQDEYSTSGRQVEMPLAVDDSDVPGNTATEQCLEHIRTIRKQYHKGSSKRPRQMKPARTRRNIHICPADASEELDVIPQPKRTRK